MGTIKAEGIWATNKLRSIIKRDVSGDVVFKAASNVGSLKVTLTGVVASSTKQANNNTNSPANFIKALKHKFKLFGTLSSYNSFTMRGDITFAGLGGVISLTSADLTTGTFAVTKTTSFGGTNNGLANPNRAWNNFMTIYFSGTGSLSASNWLEDAVTATKGAYVNSLISVQL